MQVSDLKFLQKKIITNQNRTMKIKLISKIVLPVVILLLGFTIKVTAQTQEIVIQTTAQCGECKTNIEKALMAEKGVRYAEVNMKTKTVKVAYNSKKLTPDQIRTVISKTGYDADSIPADPEAVKRLDPCCTKGGHRD